ncbi:pseudouridine synthase [Crassisporium funariophilum]|nr:pseudouridine synthase [Crassisporium funariophilum]
MSARLRLIANRSPIACSGLPMTHTPTPAPSPYEGWTRRKLIERLTLLENRTPNLLPTTSLAAKSGHPKSLQDDKKFEFSRHARRKIALKFCYSGWEYGGLAFQLGPTPLPTVENVLFDALAKARLVDRDATFDGCGWEKCGRTDRGVSAAGQVVSLWVRSALPVHEEGATKDGDGLPVIENISKEPPADSLGHDALEDDFGSLDMSGQPMNTSIPKPNKNTKPKYEHDYVAILNRLLPETIRILAWSPVSDKFSARFSCKYRHYKYFFSPLNLDTRRMQDAATRLVGEHDFRNLCKLDPSKQITSFRRNVTKASVDALDDGMYVFNLIGSAFLYHQVRHIMAVLFLVGSGLEPPSVVTELMNVEEGLEPTRDDDPAGQKYSVVDRKPEYQMADSLPLMLWECGYDEKDLDWRTTGRPDDVNGQPAVGGDLYHQLQSIHTRSRVFTTLDRHFNDAAGKYHPPPISPFPLESTLDELEGMKNAMNIPLGGGTFKRLTKYVPLLDRGRLDTVEVMNERWRLGKGMRKDEKKRLEQEDGDE